MLLMNSRSVKGSRKVENGGKGTVMADEVQVNNRAAFISFCTCTTFAFTVFLCGSEALEWKE